MSSCQGFSEVLSSADRGKAQREFLRDVQKTFDKKCVKRTREKVVFIAIEVGGAAFQGLFGGPEQCGPPQSSKGVHKRYGEAL